MKKNNIRHLEDDQILTLAQKICANDQGQAEALLLLMAEIEDAAQHSCPSDVERLTIPIKSIAFSALGDDAINAQIALLRGEVAR
jgi:hypothetical protein